MSKICGEMWTECIDVIKRKPIKTEYVLMSGVTYGISSKCTNLIYKLITKRQNDFS